MCEMKKRTYRDIFIDRRSTIGIYEKITWISLKILYYGIMNRVTIIINKSNCEVTQDDIDYLRWLWIINWCWWKWQWLLVFILKRICPYWIEASCDRHDIGYLKGGTEKRRQHCDQRFLETMLNDGFSKIKSKIHYLWYCILCILAYYLIRIYWKKFFNYRLSGIYIN